MKGAQRLAAILQIGPLGKIFEIRTLFDTGADCSFINRSLFTALQQAGAQLPYQKSATTITIKPALGAPITELNHKTSIPIFVKGCYKIIQDVLIVPGLSHELIIGMNILAGDTDMQVKNNWGTITLQGLPPINVGPFDHAPSDQATSEAASLRTVPLRWAYAAETITLPPHTQTTIKCQTPAGAEDETLFVEAHNIHPTIKIGRALIKLTTPNLFYLPIINSGNTAFFVRYGKRLCVLEPSEEVHNDTLSQPSTSQDNNTETTCTNIISAEPEEREWPHSEKECPLSFIKLPPHLSEDEKIAAQELLHEYKDLFVVSNSDIGRTSLFKHRIDTGSQQPIKQRARNVPYTLQSVILKEVNDMLEADIIRPSNSPWSSPVVLVKKPDGSYRFAVDYRTLNEKTIKDAYPLPIIQNILDTLSNSSYFSSLDLKSGFWQIELDEESKPKTAFSIPTPHKLGAQFEFNTMPFGITNAPGSFSRLIDLIFGDMIPHELQAYIDDLNVHSSTFESHLPSLRKVFNKLRAAGLKLNAKKCKLFQTEIKYLGHQIKNNTISPDPDKIQAVATIQPPQTVRQLQSFLGLANYYRKFIKSFAEKARPLTRLLNKGIKYVWGSEQQEAFETLKSALIGDLILHLPDMTRPFMVKVDASSYALGAILTQVDDERRERVVAYASRTLNTHERKWGASEKECLSLVYAVTHFHNFLYGNHFTIITDHAALKYLKKQRDSNHKLLRWSLRLAEYDFTVIHKSGKLHVDADALSRLRSDTVHELLNPSPPMDTEISVLQLSAIPWEPVSDKIHDVAAAHVQSAKNINTTPPLDIPSIRSAQRNDPTCSGIIRALQQIKIQDPQQRGLSNFKLKNDILLSSGNGRAISKGLWRIVLPPALRYSALLQMHDHPLAGHLKTARTLARLQQRFYWDTMAHDVSIYCNSCPICQSAAKKKPLSSKHNPVMMIATPQSSMEVLCIDFVGPLPRTRYNNRYILVLTCRLTRWATAVPATNADAATVAKTLIERIMCVFGCPRVLQSDRGTHFTAGIIEVINSMMDTRHIMGTSYSPTSQGLVEAYNKVLLGMLRKYTDEQQDDWCLYIPYVLFAYNTAKHETLKMTPYEMMFGKEAVLPVDVSLLPMPDTIKDPNQYAAEIKDRIQKLQQQGILNIQKQQQRIENKRPPLDSLQTFKPNDRVWVYNPVLPRQLSAKLRRAYKGPFRIIKQKGIKSYIVQEEGSRKQLHVGLDRLKPFATLPEALLPTPSNFKPLIQVEKYSEDPPDDSDNEEPVSEQNQSSSPTNISKTLKPSFALFPNHEWKETTVHKLRLHSRLRLQYHGPVPSARGVYAYASIISLKRTKNGRIRYVRLQWLPGSSFQHDQEKMNEKPYLTAEGLTSCYELWEELPILPLSHKRSLQIPIQAILDDKLQDGTRYYLAQWPDKPVEEASWVDNADLQDCADLIQEYHRTKKRSRITQKKYQHHVATTEVSMAVRAGMRKGSRQCRLCGLRGHISNACFSSKK